MLTEDTQAAYNILQKALLPSEEQAEITKLDKQKMLMLLAIRARWTQNPQDLRQFLVGTVAYLLEVTDPSELPGESSVEFFIGPNEAAN